MTMQKNEAASPEAQSANLVADNVAQLKAFVPGAGDRGTERPGGQPGRSEGAGGRRDGDRHLRTNSTKERLMGSADMVCTNCGHQGRPKRVTKGSILIEIVA